MDDEPLPNGAIGWDGKQALFPKEKLPPADFSPPTYEDWIALTDLPGRVYGTRSRGDTLQALDRAYKEWREDMSSFRAADALRNQLWQYTNKAVSQPGTHAERNKGNIFGKLQALLDVFLSSTSESARTYSEWLVGMRMIQEQRLERMRRLILMLMANVDVEPDWSSDIIGGLGLCPGVRDLVGKTAGDAGVKISDISMGSVGGGGVVVGGVVMRQQVIDAVSSIKLPNILPTYEDLQAAAAAIRNPTWEGFRQGALGVLGDVGDAIVAGVKLLWDALVWVIKKLGEILTDTLTKIYGGDLSRLTLIVSLILKVTFHFVCKKAAPFVSGAKSLVDGINSTVAAGLEELKNAAARSIIRTSEPTFAALRTGIEAGLSRKRNLGLWMTAKGSIEITVTALTAGAGGAIAGVVLGAIDWAFKMGLKIYEHSCIQDIRSESITMFNYVENGAAITTAAPKAKEVWVRPESLTKTDPALSLKSFGDRVAAKASHTKEMAKYTYEATFGAYVSGYMPAFAAASFSNIGTGFYRNQNNSFLVYLNSLCNASSVLAAAVFNSGIFEEDASMVFHAVTSRTQEDENTAVEHIKRLKSQARTLYQESGFKIKPVPVTAFKDTDREELNRLCQGAQLLVIA